MTAMTSYQSMPRPDALTDAQLLRQSWTIDSAFRYCERLARAHYENFPVGSLLIPKTLRKHFYSLYAFARTADDFADEGEADSHNENVRLADLNEWRSRLQQAFQGQATHPIFIALAATCESFRLPQEHFEDLLSAFTQDVTTRRYASFSDLLDYCRRSANPIGRLILRLFGYEDEEKFLWSDDICTALQLTNHWQDVRVDLKKDRIYLPLADLARFGVTVEALQNRTATAEIRELMRFEVERARQLFLRGKPLCTAVGGRLGFELRAVWQGGWRILDRIAQNRYDVLQHRPVITKMDKLKLLVPTLWKERF